MIQGSVLTTAPPIGNSSESNLWEYLLFAVVTMVIVVPCGIWAWKSGCLHGVCCQRTKGPVRYGRTDFADNFEQSVTAGPFMGYPGGPNYRLMSHPQLCFAHGQGPRGAPMKPMCPMYTPPIVKDSSVTSKPVHKTSMPASLKELSVPLTVIAQATAPTLTNEVKSEQA